MEQYEINGFINQLKKCDCMREDLIPKIKADLIKSDLIREECCAVTPYGIEINVLTDNGEKPIYFIIDLCNIKLTLSPKENVKPFWSMNINRFFNNYEDGVKKFLLNVGIYISFCNKGLYK